MSGDHNMNQSDSGWRKRQIALNKKAENARELGLDYEPTIIEMAREAGAIEMRDNDSMGWGCEFELNQLEAFALLVREDERNSWPAEMEAMERQVNILTDALAKAKAQEREACAKVCEDLDAWVMDDPGSTAAKAIRARGDKHDTR